MTVFGREERETLAAAGADEFVQRYLHRWAEQLEVAIDVDATLQRLIEACFGTYVYNPWAYDLPVRLSGSGCITTRLSLLQMQVVPETTFGLDPEVIAARSMTASPSFEAAQYQSDGLQIVLQRYLRLTPSEAMLRAGGPKLIGERLAQVPAIMLPYLKRTHDAEAWVWLYHFGVTDVRPPNFDDPAFWDSLPDLTNE
ncbi:MAG: hypothetical protein KC933_31095 [Myxococcales bacterium]|nr:hypothetical protein [Myxococcales bacterium]MCB9646709.1 hypothetical protein [Deltaproteobacteria bacterium]